MDGWRLLGPVGLVAGGREVDLGPAKQRCVLAVLLMTPGRPVPTPVLLERVWGERPPRSPHAAAPYVTRLRHAVPPGFGVLRHAAGGYCLDCDPDLVDLHRARRLAASARTGPDEEAAELLAAALAGWGPAPLAGLPGDWAARTRAALEHEGLDLHGQRAAADLRLGRHAAVAERLRPLVAEHPTAEGLTEALMQALAGCGSSAEALDAYGALRTALVRELGAEPSRPVADLQVRILRDDPALVRRAPARRAPAELPADVAGFTGRAAELAELGGSAVTLVTGTAGVGKTALVVRWAHRHRSEFPDGQLHLDLRGYDPDRPVTPAEALSRLLAGLGVPERDVPVDTDGRAARLRTELADRRLLLVLDNASAVDQVRPLLPGAGGCRVLVTSRDALPGLVVRDGARRLVLDLLPEPDAVALLHGLVGARVTAAPAAARTLAARCARLPLALRVAAELAAARPGTALDRLVGGLDELEVGGDPQTAVRTVLSWSVARLPAATARTFALLGLHPAGPPGAYATAALTGSTVAEADRALAELVRAHLLDPVEGMHDLLREYATGLVAPADRAAATGRLLDFHVGTAAAAMDRLHPAEARRRPSVPRPATPYPPLPDTDSAREWLDAERATLVALASTAPDRAVTLSALLFRYLIGGHLIDGLDLHGAAVTAAAAAGDKAGEAQARNGVGATLWFLGRYEPARAELEQARELFVAAGDPLGECRALTNLGAVEERLGRYRVAARHHERALACSRAGGDRMLSGRVLNNLGDVWARLGRLEEAAAAQVEALAVAREFGDRHGEAEALHHLGGVEERLGRCDPAAGHLAEAVDACRELDDRIGEAHSLHALGAVLLRQGRVDEAADHFGRALALFRAPDERDGAAWALNGLGEAALAGGRPRAALEHHGAALALAAEVGVPDQQARADRGLAAAHRRLADRDRAAEHYRRALAVYTRLGAAEAGPVRAELAALGQCSSVRSSCAPSGRVTS